MNQYAMASIIAFTLFAMGLTALLMGVQNFSQNKQSKTTRQMLMVCACVFVWDFGYAWMSLCYDSDFAYVPRAAALLAVYLYMVFTLRYISEITSYPEKKLRIMMVVFCILGFISWPQIIRKDAVWFTTTAWGYWYYSKMTVARLIQFADVLLGLIFYYIIIHYGTKRVQTRREKFVLKRFGLFGPILFTGYMFDTLIPSLFKTPAIPGSGIAAFIAAMILYNIARINRVMGLSKENVSQYVFDDVKIPIIITNDDDEIDLCNTFTYDFLRKGQRSVKGKDISEFFVENEDGNYMVVGQEKECTLEKTEIIDNFGERLYTIYFVRDITEERNSFRLMQKSKEDAEEANRAKTDFLANMSHEIRTPMNAIIGMSQVIIDSNEVSEGVVSKVNEIKIAGTNLLNIINDILDMSKIEAGKFELVKDKYDLAELIHELSSVVTARLHGGDVVFNLDIDPTVPRKMIGDENRIRQILLNVLGNAIKFTKEGSITLKVAWNYCEEAPDVIFDVVDTGIGIREEDKEKIFGKYDQADTKRNRSVQGTGLGLAISRNFAILMGGMITVDSEYGIGSTFHIVINQDIKEYNEIGEEIAAKLRNKTFVIPVRQEVIATPKRDATVLVVDDSKVNLLVATGLMKKYEMTVDTAMSGKESIEKVQQKKYNIVFMDHMMPEMDGVEAMNAIRDLGEEYKKLPIVALTANALSESKDKLLGLGFDDYLAKPINVVELDRVINKWT
ncbi:MAG: ATP-binding protein [Lachnospiraceae bacterium]|nr:ATP-binding protein [Lachnospiraceae bacterium]